MSIPEVIHVPVLIIGGGIVGLSSSLFLTHHNIKSILIERHSGTSIHPRARSLNARSMEIFHGVGLSDAMRVAGASISASWGIYSGTSLKDVIEGKKRRGEKPSKGIPGFAKDWAEFAPEQGTFVTQDMSEPVLLEAARERGGDVRFYTECLGVSQDNDKVTARLKDRENGKEYTIKADYLIAADGANSPIRSQLKVPTTGRGAMGHLLNILFTADLKPLVENREFSLCIIDRPEVVGLFTSINNSDRWVFHLSYNPDKGETPSDFPKGKCVELLKIALGIPDVDIKVLSILPWEPSVRVATQLQHGRIFLAGDAAHQMPPYFGQGANSGIADVHNLSWKLAAVIQKHAGKELLGTYNIERQPVGLRAAEASAAPADERGLITPIGLNLKTVRRMSKGMPLVAGFGYFYDSKAVVKENTWPLGGATWKSWGAGSLFLGLDGRPGSRVPHVWVERNGERTSTVGLCGNGFVLFGGCEGKVWSEACAEVKKVLEVELQCHLLSKEGETVDKNGWWETAAGISASGAILVRPDGFVAWRNRRMPADPQLALEVALRSILCC